jgi:nucleotide-binding universal stress UspA family protein
MSVKSILCIFSGAQNELNAVNEALVLGKAYGALVRFLIITPDPKAYMGLYGEGFIINQDVLDSIDKENEIKRDKAKQYIAKFAAKHDVPLDVSELPSHHASAEYINRKGLVDEIIVTEGRVSDLIVISQTVTIAPDVINTALFSTGRPVLLVPHHEKYMPREWNDKTVSLLWNGSMQAARALYNAIPLLTHAEKLYVLTIEWHGVPHDYESRDSLRKYLHIHGMNAEMVLVPAGKRTYGEVLLEKSKELKSDIVVMGAYGHSVLREMIMGGITDHMLNKADIPLLLSH